MTATPAGARPRVAVVGAGAVGSYFGGRAALAGADVTLCLRRRRPDLVIRSGSEEFRPSVRTVTDPSDVEPVDFVLLGVKAHQTSAAAQWLAALQPPEDVPPPVVVLQNGVGHRERVTGLWSGPILPAIVFCGVEMTSPGVVEHRSHGWFNVEQGPTAERLCAVFGPGQPDVVCVADITAVAWSKLVLNSVANSLTALTCRPLDLLDDPGVQAVARTLIDECVAVAVADGVELPADCASSALAVLSTPAPGATTSMLTDRLHGRDLEHEALIGSVVTIGERHGVPTPVSSLVLSLLRAVSGQPIMVAS